jgi:hypothetical protein
MNLVLVLNKISPWAHLKSEFDVLSVLGKLVKYVVHSSKRKNRKKKNSSHKLPKQQSTSFWSQGILGVKTSRGMNPTKKNNPNSHGTYLKNLVSFISFY